MSEAKAIKYVGQPLRRREDFKFVTGKGRYTDDLKAPGMLHMAVLRSPHAHANIKQVDLSAAKEAPGVRLALSGSDLAGKIGSIVPNWIMPGTKVPDRPVVAIDRVRFVGECVALVVAESQAMAHDAISVVDVDYETQLSMKKRRSVTARRSSTTTCQTTSPPSTRSVAATTRRPRGRPIMSSAFALPTIA
jgi:aerobic carbon-monoxide dehydrogenase large subunit